MTLERKPLWRGVAGGVVALFAGGGLVGVVGAGGAAGRVVASGVRAVLVAGSTGEADALGDGERVALVSAVRQACPGVPVIAGAGGAWAGPAAELTAASVAVGADAVLVAPPRRPGDLRVFYERVASAADGRPVLAYH